MKRPTRISATDLASLGYCETKAVLDRRMGECVTPRQAQARTRGLAEHSRFDAEARAHHNAPARDQRCFIASHVYGASDPRTNALRAWRDRARDKLAIWRCVFATYYRVSPHLVVFLNRCPWATPAVRGLVDLWRGLVADEDHHEQRDPSHPE